MNPSESENNISRRDAMRSVAGLSLAVLSPHHKIDNAVKRTPTSQDKRMVPSNWHETRVQVGHDVSDPLLLDNLAGLEQPATTYPFVAKLLIHAPTEARWAFLDFYYDIARGGVQTFAREDALVYARFQKINDPSQPFVVNENLLLPTVDPNDSDGMNWIRQNSKNVADAMRASLIGQQLGQTLSSGTISVNRPDNGVTVALVVKDQYFSGIQIPAVVFAQRFVFVDQAENSSN